ncbi:hypothetical protein Gbfr_040_003 [Gluconobacter frateurii M-2]|nr:hypothetical protein Gbfr_040_003 [Gluconobacter frateurii M-2]
MTWPPCRRIVRADVPPSFQVRGINAPLFLSWPNAALNGSADYSVDFSGVLCCGDKIQEAAVSAPGGSVVWVTVFAGTLATAWITWTSTGLQSVEVTILTTSGATITVDVSIVVRSESALINGDHAGYPPNALILSDGTLLETAAGAQILTT